MSFKKYLNPFWYLTWMVTPFFLASKEMSCQFKHILFNECSVGSINLSYFGSQIYLNFCNLDRRSLKTLSYLRNTKPEFIAASELNFLITHKIILKNKLDKLQKQGTCSGIILTIKKIWMTLEPFYLLIVGTSPYSLIWKERPCDFKHFCLTNSQGIHYRFSDILRGH